MGHGGQFDIERTDVESAPERDDGDGDFRRARLARTFGFEQSSGERRGEDRDLQLRP